MKSRHSHPSYAAMTMMAITLITGQIVMAQSVSVTPPVMPGLSLDKAYWIWGDPGDMVVQMRTTLSLETAPSAAGILITADNGYELYINGAEVGFDIGAGGEVWQSVEYYDVTSRLARGNNVIGIRGTDLGGIRGLVAALRIESPGSPVLEIGTDARWQVAIQGNPGDYSHPEYVEDSAWTNATVLGPLGMSPWGKLKPGDSKGGRRPLALAGAIAMIEPPEDFLWPKGLVFVGDDCSVYTPLRGDAWGVCFRVGDWTRAYTEFDIPCPSKIGRKLFALQPTGPKAEPRLLVDAGRGVLGSPSVSYDGRSIYLAMAQEGENFFHIYRLPAGGGTPQRLSQGPFHDIDPAELPDGRIVFTSTRIGSFEEYHNPPSRALFVMNSDGRDIQPITFTPIFDNEPKVMADGRIAFIRTDNFFDRAKVETQIHVICPDGTRGMTEIGADQGPDYGMRLRAFGYGSPAPMPDGRLACISSRGNFVAIPGSAESSFHRLPGGLGDLAPLPDGRLLATVLRPGIGRMNSDVIAVIDPQDNQVATIFKSSNGPVHSPVFLGPRPRPPQLASLVPPPGMENGNATGFLFCENVRFTKKTKADWEQVRAIRVLGALALTTRSSHSHIVHAGHETVELGTVPLAPDGSFHIEVPADMPLALQAVDAEGRSELNEMSWIYVRPGERRSCLGCHNPQRITSSHEHQNSLALRSPPLKVLGQGQAYRFRGNNSGVTGMMDLQLERFRETASLNAHRISNGALTTGREEVAALIAQLRGPDESLKISASQRLAARRDRSAAPALVERLQDDNREVRVASATALAACGTRNSIAALLDAMEDRNQIVAAAAHMAMANLIDHSQPFDAFAGVEQRKVQSTAWRQWFKEHSWPMIETALISKLNLPSPHNPRRAIVALGHVGGLKACEALRDFVKREKNRNFYEPFINNNRTDRFTFGAQSPWNPRTLQEAVRALGHLKDTGAIQLLTTILSDNIEPRSANLFLAEAAIEALGRIGTWECEEVLIDTFSRLKNYYEYVGWYSDHPALYACHNSPLHARIIEALDAIGSMGTADIVPDLIGSVPTDPDRALFPENDDYETLTGRVIRRSGRADEMIENCLSLLGDKSAKACAELTQAISTTWAAWAGHPAPDNRAAQMLSLVCRDPSYEPRIRRLYEQYRAKPEDPIRRPLGNPEWIPQRHWVLFYLGRTLGNLGDPRSVDTLLASLDAELNEARHGHPDPSEPNIHFLQLEYTPCWRASAAWALGCIGDERAVPTLIRVVENLKNATDVRHASAEALEKLVDPSQLEAIMDLAEEYPEYSTRKVLKKVQAKAAGHPYTTLME